MIKELKDRFLEKYIILPVENKCLYYLIHFRKKFKARIQQSKALHKVLTPFGSEPFPERWIFVVGCYNSGTTLLENLLARHPQIGGLPHEGVFLTDSLPKPEDFGWTRMWYKCLEDVRLEPSSGDGRRARRIRRQWSFWFPKGVPNLLEKSVANTTRMPFLQAHFRPAYFIHIVRNGYAVAEGIRRKARPARWGNKDFPNGYPIEMCARQWVETERLVERDRPSLDRFLTVSYEDLTEDPQKILNQIFVFLGIDPVPLQGDTNRLRPFLSHVLNMNSKSFHNLGRRSREVIKEEGREYLSKYGYE